MARALLPAPVPPMVALWISGRYGNELRQAAELYARRGMPDVARQFMVTIAYLQTAAAQLSNEAVAAAMTTAGGSSETEIRSSLESSELLTTKEAAKRLGLSRERVGQLLNAGDLAGRKVGRMWQVVPQSVDDAIEARRAA